MKERITIDSAHGTFVQVYMDIPDTESNKDLIVFVPGLLENFNSPLLEQTSYQFNQAGFTTVRVDSPSFYGNNYGLKATSIGTQATDLNRVVSYFRSRFDQIALVAHSMGAFVALASNSDVDSVILWDPSLHPREILVSVIRDTKREVYYDSQLKQDISPMLIEELPHLLDIAQVAQTASFPVGIISAPHGVVCPADPYIQNLPFLIGHTTIEGADHNFSTPKHRSVLVRETVIFIKKATQEDGPIKKKK